MKIIKTFTICFISFLLFSCEKSSVYLCMGETSECYHKNKTCKGLINCSKEIISVKLDEAISKYNRRPCGFCYKTR